MAEKRRRRGHGEGSVTQRPDGRWHVRIDLGRGIDGRRRRKHVYADTQADAIEQLRRVGGRAVDGQLVATSSPTVARYLEEWFTDHCNATDRRGAWRASTQRGYRRAIDGFLVPAFGTHRLEQLSPLIVQAWLREHTSKHGARRRIALAHAVLRSALAAAQRLQLVTINAATLVEVPKPAKRPITPLDVTQAATFLAVAALHRLNALFSVALACGLRLGEATGLRWQDVDLDAGVIHVRVQLQRVRHPGDLKPTLILQDLKTKTSRRTLALPRVCLDALKAHRTRQLEERLKAGPRWIDTGLVFTTYRVCTEGKGRSFHVGAPLHPRNVLRTLHGLLGDADLPRVRFHDLRHSAASLLIAEGVELVEVSKLLGHSQLAITADLYTHLQKQTSVKAARIMDAILPR